MKKKKAKRKSSKKCYIVISKKKKHTYGAFTFTPEGLEKAKEYIGAGGDVKAIKTKYKLTAVQEKELNGQKANTKEA